MSWNDYKYPPRPVIGKSIGIGERSIYLEISRYKKKDHLKAWFGKDKFIDEKVDSLATFEECIALLKQRVIEYLLNAVDKVNDLDDTIT